MSNTEAKNPSTIRRALLAISTPNGFVRRNLAGIIVLGILVALTGPAAEAANGDPVLLGNINIASSTTAVHTSSGYGLDGLTSDPSRGYASVLGQNTGGGNGVEGSSRNFNGVYGYTQSSTASGVYGENNFGGFGVAGRTFNSGVAVLADDADGTGVALRTTGKLQFQNRSGIVRVASGQKSITVTLAGVTASSMVTATVQRTGGFFVQAAVPAAGSFKIYINKAPVSPTTVKVAYLVLN
jgi:hypothetical protein